MPRLFVALDLPEAAQRALASLREGAFDVRWTPPERYHLTLRFLGDVEAADAVAGALADVRARPFRLRLSGLGVFPSARKPRVLIARAEAEPALEALHRRVEAALGLLGAEPDPKPFRPHVTLARFRRNPPPSSDLRAYLNAYRDVDVAWDVRRFVLYESLLRPKGAQHRPLATFRLE